MRELTTETFDGAIKSKTPVLIEFWAVWCMPCKIFAPVLEQLSDELGGNAEICKVNIDDYQDLAVANGIEVIPTVILFKDGKELDRAAGILQKDDIIKMIEAHI
ncbi:MAG: thioredoxin [Oscillospiraceae bacterium]|nr:thioredoxin [Oscillospiraceae bacterium]